MRQSCLIFRMSGSEEILNRPSWVQDPSFMVILHKVRRWESHLLRARQQSQLVSWHSDGRAISQGSVRPPSFRKLGMFSALRGEVESSWAFLTVSDSPAHLHYAFSKPTCFLSGPVNLLLRGVILFSFYSTLFWAIICVALITDFLAADKLKGLGCPRTAARLCPGCCPDVSLPV